MQIATGKSDQYSGHSPCRCAVMDTVSLSDAKSRFAHLVQAAEAGQVVHISRHDKPVAVLLSEQAYAALYPLACSQALGDAINRWRRAGRSGWDEDWPLASDPSADQEVALWRDLAPADVARCRQALAALNRPTMKRSTRLG
jgi:prevent-host-death family protein